MKRERQIYMRTTSQESIKSSLVLLNSTQLVVGVPDSFVEPSSVKDTVDPPDRRLPLGHFRTINNCQSITARC